MKLVGVAVVALLAGVAAWFLLRSAPDPTPAAEPGPGSAPGPTTSTAPRPGPSLPAGGTAPTGTGPSLPSPDDPTGPPVVVDHRQGSGGTAELPPGEAIDPGPQLAPTVTSAYHADVRPLVMPCVAGATGAGGAPGRLKVTTTGDIKGGTMTVTGAKVDLAGASGVDAAKVEACVQKALVGRTQSAGTTGDVSGYEVRLSYVVR